MSSEDIKSKPYLPVAGARSDGYNNGVETTATCFCGEVQYAFPIKEVKTSMICHCTDCHKLHSSMFGTLFLVPQSSVTILRGASLLQTYSTSTPIATGNTMTNHFCKNCGTLMWRSSSGYEGMVLGRLGTLDDFSLMEGALRPQGEIYTEVKAKWLGDFDGMRATKQEDISV
ncbi:Hypothetical protein D9617_19g103370 [Elsinoe fawcettii]|nr:Hypothetical protein D9617_19g103370 [Elsinoe fawcettii]